METWTGGAPQYGTGYGTVVSVDMKNLIVVIDMEQGSYKAPVNPATFDFSGNGKAVGMLEGLEPGIRVSIGYELNPMASGAYGGGELTVLEQPSE